MGDLAAFLGLRVPMLRDAVRDQHRLLAFNAQLGAHCAVVVDRLAGLRNAEQLQPVPEDGQPRPAFAGLTMDRPRLMGILNVTPDSFSDGGLFLGAEAAVAQAQGRELPVRPKNPVERHLRPTGAEQQP